METTIVTMLRRLEILRYFRGIFSSFHLLTTLYEGRAFLPTRFLLCFPDLAAQTQSLRENKRIFSVFSASQWQNFVHQINNSSPSRSSRVRAPDGRTSKTSKWRLRHL